jgi:putative endonuclease
MRRQKYLYVYILKCNDNSYYTGVTNNPERRIEEHSRGFDKECYTYTRRPVEIVYYEYFTDFKLAISWEKKIKNWSKKKKEALINSDWKKLSEAAECKNETSHKNLKLLDSARSDIEG